MYEISPYQMNVVAFTQHSANFRHDNVDSFFANLGIDNASTRTCKTKALSQWLETDNGTEHGESDASAGQIKTLLDGLVERRNEVAHGRWESDLLGRDDLLRYVNFLRAYATSLYEIIFGSALKCMQNKLLCLGNPINVFNSKIVCLRLQGVTVRIGSKLAAKLPDGGYRWGKVVNLQRDHEAIGSVSPEQSIDVGIEVDFEAKDNQTYYLLDGFV